jgi:hypothetical protein
VQRTAHVYRQRQCRIHTWVGDADSGQVDDHLRHGVGHSGLDRSGVAQVKDHPSRLPRQRSNPLWTFVRGYTGINARTGGDQSPHQALPDETRRPGNEDSPLHPTGRLTDQ